MKINISVIFFSFICSVIIAQNKDSSVVFDTDVLKRELKVLKQKKIGLRAEIYPGKIFAVALSTEIRVDEMYNTQKHFIKINETRNIAYAHAGNYFPTIEFSYRDKCFNDNSIGFSLSRSEVSVLGKVINPENRLYSSSVTGYYSYNYLFFKKFRDRFSFLPYIGGRLIYSFIQDEQQFLFTDRNFWYKRFDIKQSINDIFIQLSPGFKLLNKKLKFEIGCNLNLSSIVLGHYTEYIESNIYQSQSYYYSNTSTTKKISNICLANSDAILSSVFLKLGFNFGFRKK